VNNADGQPCPQAAGGLDSDYTVKVTKLIQTKLAQCLPKTISQAE